MNAGAEVGLFLSSIWLVGVLTAYLVGVAVRLLS